MRGGRTDAAGEDDPVAPDVRRCAAHSGERVRGGIGKARVSARQRDDSVIALPLSAFAIRSAILR
jgi:hypothetical protein